MQYQKMTDIDHALLRPDMYVGSTTLTTMEEYIFENNRIYKKKIQISPALQRIFIEPLSNVIDNVARSKADKNPTTEIRVDIDKESGKTSFWNNGNIIPIQKHETENVYIHTMLFGMFRTGSNYNDSEDREDISGRNGMGITCTNVFSKKFIVEACDNKNKKTFKQIWKNNMKEHNKPTIGEALKNDKNFTKITYTPDFSQFEIEGYTDDIIAYYKKLLVDTAMICKVPLYFNDILLQVNNLISYSKLYSSDEKDTLYIKSPDCEVLVMPNLGGFEFIAFSNGINNPLGGTHINAWSEALFRPIVEKMNKGKNKPQINIADVKKFFRLFVVATVKKPKWESQSKLELKSPEVKPNVKKSHIDTICSWSVYAHIEDIVRNKELSVLKKVERKKRGHESVEGLDPANHEGGKFGRECTLILVEGLSAKTYASSGIKHGAFGKEGRDWFGIYALRGKVLNCRKNKPMTIAKNKVITDIIKALGLSYGLDYTKEANFNKLRYGRVMILTDADVDGIHISGLIQNMFHSLFPTLLSRENAFITSMQTPIVRVYGKPDILFYDEQEYRTYVKQNINKKINKKYYKGLGANTRQDIAETFGKKLIEYRLDEKSFDTMNKIFNNDTDYRKEWMEFFDPEKTVFKWNGNKPEVKDISFSEFLDTELIKFSVEDCKRSIPHILDGLKEGHRKVLYVCFLSKLKSGGKTIKVAQLAGKVAEKSGYHHGENNLFNTITGMASLFVGSNNIPLLSRDGEFGSRLSGGDDAPNARYIFTTLDDLTRYIYREEDDELLEHVEDDGEMVEPKFYIPIIPMILVNGSKGIGTGWSCNIPSYNPLDLIDSIQVWLENDGNVISESDDMVLSLLPEIKPWYWGYKGTIEKVAEQKYISKGIVEEGNGTLKITELPIGYWTDDFKNKLEKMKEEKQIKSYTNQSDPVSVDFTIHENGEYDCNENSLRLYKYISTTNMVLFHEKGKLKKFKNTDEIICHFCKVRFDYYVKRKEHNLNKMKHDIKYLGNKKRFLEYIRDGVIKLFEIKSGKNSSKKTLDLVSELEKLNFDKMVEIESEEDEIKGHGFEYLLRLTINSITAEKINKLNNEIESKIKQFEDLKNTSEKQIWLNELKEFENAYKKWMVKAEKELEIIAKESKKKKKK